MVVRFILIYLSWNSGWGCAVHRRPNVHAADTINGGRDDDGDAVDKRDEQPGGEAGPVVPRGEGPAHASVGGAEHGVPGGMLHPQRGERARDDHAAGGVEPERGQPHLRLRGADLGAHRAGGAAHGALRQEAAEDEAGLLRGDGAGGARFRELLQELARARHHHALHHGGLLPDHAREPLPDLAGQVHPSHPPPIPQEPHVIIIALLFSNVFKAFVCLVDFLLLLLL